MKYSLNLGYWSSIFAVPTILVEKYINSANLTQIKVLLWILSNKEIDSQKAITDLNLTFKEFDESFTYWKNLGFFSIQKENLLKSVGNKAVINNTQFKPQRPSTSYIISRIKESNEINLLMKEVQIILKRPLSNSDTATLLMLHDDEGLPADVILMLVRHCIESGKGSMRYIYATGVNWANLGIDSIEKAEKKIEYLNRSNALWKKFQSLVGIEYRLPTSTEESIVMRWYQDWNFKDDLIKYAYELCVDTKGKYIIKYIDSILRRWYNQGIFTVDQAKENRKIFKSQSKYEEFKTYDLEAYEKYDIFGDD